MSTQVHISRRIRLSTVGAVPNGAIVHIDGYWGVVEKLEPHGRRIRQVDFWELPRAWVPVNVTCKWLLNDRPHVAAPMPR